MQFLYFSRDLISLSVMIANRQLSVATTFTVFYDISFFSRSITNFDFCFPPNQEIIYHVRQI